MSRFVAHSRVEIWGDEAESVVEGEDRVVGVAEEENEVDVFLLDQFVIEKGFQVKADLFDEDVRCFAEDGSFDLVKRLNSLAVQPIKSPCLSPVYRGREGLGVDVGDEAGFVVDGEVAARFDHAHEGDGERSWGGDEIDDLLGLSKAGEGC